MLQPLGEVGDVKKHLIDAALFHDNVIAKRGQKVKDELACYSVRLQCNLVVRVVGVGMILVFRIPNTIRWNTRILQMRTLGNRRRKTFHALDAKLPCGVSHSNQVSPLAEDVGDSAAVDVEAEGLDLRVEAVEVHVDDASHSGGGRRSSFGGGFCC